MSLAIEELKTTIRDTIYLRDTLWQLPTSAHLSANSPTIGGATVQSLMSHRSTGDQTRQFLTYGKNYPFVASSPLMAPGINPWIQNHSYLLQTKSSKPFISSDGSSFTSATGLRKPGVRVENILFKSIVPQFQFKRGISLHPYRALYAGEIIQLGRRRKIWDALLPEQHRIALIGGALNAITNELEHPGEWLLSLQYEMLFSPRLSLLTGLRYRNFSAKNEHDLKDLSYPLPPDMMAGDQLHEIYLNNQYISVPILVKYSIPLWRHFHPYLHSGLLFTKTISQNYKFEINRRGMDLNLNSKIGEGPLILSSCLVGAGVEYWLSQRVSTSLDLEGRYQFKLSNIEVQKNNGLGVRLGIHYSL